MMALRGSSRGDDINPDEDDISPLETSNWPSAAPTQTQTLIPLEEDVCFRAEQGEQILHELHGVRDQVVAGFNPFSSWKSWANSNLSMLVTFFLFATFVVTLNLISNQLQKYLDRKETLKRRRELDERFDNLENGLNDRIERRIGELEDGAKAILDAVTEDSSWN